MKPKMRDDEVVVEETYPIVRPKKKSCRSCKILREALEAILVFAKDHPAFDAELFERRDIDALSDVGGDICDWTACVGIVAADALKKVDGEKEGCGR